MTKEELLKKIDFEKSWLCDCGIFGSDVDIAFHAIKNSVIEALEQEPCEDCISRQAVLKLMGEEPFNWTDSDKELQAVEDYRNFRNIVEQLPSVNPQKTGHWIADVDKWGDIVTTVNGYRCDKCNTFNADKDNYCPNCGAKMVELKESTEPHECNTCKFGSYYKNGYDVTTMDDECGGCCSWNDKWQQKESEVKNG